MITRKSCINDAPACGNTAGAFPVMIKGMRKAVRAVLVVLIILFSSISMPSIAFADDSYTTDVFDVNIDITENHVIKYEEKITVDFLSPHHGIYRYIPVQKKFYDVKDIHVYGGDYESSYDTTGENENGTYGNQVLQIGDPYNTYTGEMNYRILYSLVCTRDEDDDKDYLSADLLPTGWQTPIGSATVNLTLPKKVDWNDVHLFSGKAGDKADPVESDSNFKVVYGKDGKTLQVVASDLEKGEGVTIQAELPEGYWEGVTSRRPLIFFAYVIPMIAALLMLVMWLIDGRDPDVVKPVEFYPPDELTPAEVGYLVDGSIDDKDISSMLLYFASKGYLEIRETTKKGEKYILVKKKDIPDTEPTFAVRLFGGIFPYEKAKEGEEQKAYLDSLPDGFADAVKVAKDQLKSMYDSGKKRMFKPGSRGARNLGKVICALILPVVLLIAAYTRYTVFGFISTLFPFILVTIGVGLISTSYDNRHSSGRVQSVMKFIIGVVLAGLAAAATIGFTVAMGVSPLVGIVAAVCLAVCIFFEVFMWARTKENAAVYGKILGFRNFIATAEYDRLKALSDENPEYYYDIMPYAMVMGMSVAWAKKFEKLNVPDPEWYQGGQSLNMYDTMWYSHMMDSCSSQFFTKPDLTDAIDTGGFFTGGGFSGGGFGGGGFSGGGFGGGGGGAW